MIPGFTLPSRSAWHAAGRANARRRGRPQARAAAAARAERARRRGRPGRQRRGRLVDGACEPVRRDRPRRHAAGAGRLRDVCPDAGRRRVDARPAADGARCRRGPRARARLGCRRLPDEAVLGRGAARPSARDRASRGERAADGAPGRRPAPRSGRPARLARRCRDRALGQGARPTGAADAAGRRGRVALRPARARVGHELRQPLERRHRARAPSARKGRPPLRPDSIETVRGSGYRIRPD